MEKATRTPPIVKGFPILVSDSNFCKWGFGCINQVVNKATSRDYPEISGEKPRLTT